MELHSAVNNAGINLGFDGAQTAGLRLGPYELAEEIGRGGIGKVFRAIDAVQQCEVAIKVLRDELADDPGYVGDFLQEARDASTIRHLHIGRVFGLGRDNGRYYIVMELLKGQSLDRIIEQNGPLDEPAALHIGIQVARALKAACKRHLVHGDIKPANIFLTESAGAKVLDFGLARRATTGQWASDSVLGSPYYISPERVLQNAETYHSDMYGLGATLFHALAGRPPYDGRTPYEGGVKRPFATPPRLRAVNPTITAKTE